MFLPEHLSLRSETRESVFSPKWQRHHSDLLDALAVISIASAALIRKRDKDVSYIKELVLYYKLAY
jgi:hypothetical protein